MFVKTYNVIGGLMSFIKRNYLVLILSTVFLVFRAHYPVAVFTTSGADDGLYLKLAASILKGEWLGEFDQFTNVKGPFLSLFIALSWIVGLNYAQAVALVQLAASLLLFKALNATGVTRAVSHAAFAILVFHPFMIPTRILRTEIYSSIAIAAVALLILLFHRKIDKSSWRTWLSICLGFLLGLSLILRDDTHWLVLTLAGLFFIYALVSHRYLATFSLLCAVAVSALIPSVAVASMNYVNYGAFVVSDLYGGEFGEFQSKLKSLGDRENPDYILVSMEQMRMLGESSPKFAEMLPFLEGPGLQWGQNAACGLLPSTCGEIGAGWLSFALRDAASSLGYYSSAQQAEDYWRSINEEFTRACRIKSLSCTRPVLPGVSVVTPRTFGLFGEALATSLQIATAQTTKEMDAGFSYDPRATLNQMRYLLGNTYTKPSPSEVTVEISGWIGTQNNSRAAISCPLGSSTAVIALPESRAPAGLNPMPKESPQYFSIREDYIFGCNLTLNNGQIQVPIQSLRVGLNELASGVDSKTWIWIDVLDIQTGLPDQNLQAAISVILLQFYKILSPLLFVFSALSLFWLVRPKIRGRSVLVLASVMFTFGIARLTLVSWVAATAFPASPDYLMPAPVLLCVSGVLTIGVFSQSLIERIKNVVTKSL